MSEQAGHHVGHRHTDPRHKAGDWWTDRDTNTTDQQGGRTTRGARHSTDEEPE